MRRRKWGGRGCEGGGVKEGVRTRRRGKVRAAGRG